MGHYDVMKKLFSFAAVAAAITFAACTGNKAETAAQDEACCEGEKTEECAGCPVKAVTEALNAALESGDAQTIGQAVKDAVAAAAELAKAGKNEAVDALVQNVQQFLTTNEQKLQELGAIEAVKSFPATVKETVEAVAASAESGAAAVKEQAEAAANQAVEDAKATAEQKVEEAKDAAAQKVDEAAQKASEKVDEAAQKASQKADEAAADAAAKAKKKLGL